MVTMNISDLQAQMLDRLSNEQVASVFPLIEQMLLDSKQEVKREAISLVKGFFLIRTSQATNARTVCLLSLSLKLLKSMYQ